MLGDGFTACCGEGQRLSFSKDCHTRNEACQGGEAFPSSKKGRKGNQQVLKNQAGQRRGLPPADIRALVLGTSGQHRQLPAKHMRLWCSLQALTNTPAKGSGLEEKASSPDSECSTVSVGLESHFCHLWPG